MYLLEKTFTFEAAHMLPEHDGKCRRLHGHSWKMTVRLCSNKVQETGPKRGMVLDFYEIKKAVEPLIENFLDHHYLNDTLGIYPTSENVAKWVWDYLSKRSIPSEIKLHSITIHETCTSSCTYTERDYGT